MKDAKRVTNMQTDVKMSKITYEKNERKLIIR